MLTALSDNSHYERAAPATCTQISVKASTNQASSRTPSPRTPHLAAEWSPAVVAAARALCWHLPKYQSHIKVCSTFSPFSSQSSKEKIFFFFFPPTLTDLGKNISSLCLHRSSCFCANYNAFPIHREKGGPERNLQDISLGMLVAKRVMLILFTALKYPCNHFD